MRLIPGALRLTSEPELWNVRLRSGEELEVLTHGYSIEGDDCEFSLLFEGTPNFFVTSLRIPLALLEDGFPSA